MQETTKTTGPAYPINRQGRVQHLGQITARLMRSVHAFTGKQTVQTWKSRGGRNYRAGGAVA